MRSGTRNLSRQLGLATAGAAVAVVVVCAVGLISLGNVSAVAREAVEQQLRFARDTGAMGRFFYQKGFVAEYLLTGSRHWLEDLENSRPAFESWLHGAHERITGEEGGELVKKVRDAYAAFDLVRREAIRLHDAGQVAEARLRLESNRLHAQRLRELFERLESFTEAEAERRMTEAERAVRRLAALLVVTSLAGAAAATWVGFLWARRVTKPLGQLEVIIETAVERTRIAVNTGRAGLEVLGDQVEAMAERLQRTDATLAEHRSRLIQSEKLSAIGEIATKLAHEVLNPLAGIKAAVQVFARREGEKAPSEVELVAAVDREVGRVDALLRRLMTFSRPLSPRFQVVDVKTIVDGAVGSVALALEKNAAHLERSDEPSLPPLEADPLLLGRAVANLIKNAAEALPATGGKVWLNTSKRQSHGRAEIVVEVIDEGTGLSEAAQHQLFKPFVTTKPEGHGLGLALSQNIVLEHGGLIRGRNRAPAEGSGAHFEISLPLVR